MTIMSPETAWGELLDYVKDKDKRPDGMAYRLKTEASDKEKQRFEGYMMEENGFFLKAFFPEIKDPYYTWEGEIVERSSLKDRDLPLVEISEDTDVMM